MLAKYILSVVIFIPPPFYCLPLLPHNKISTPNAYFWAFFTPCAICRSIFYGVFHQVALKAQNVGTTWCTYQLQGFVITDGIVEN